LEDSGDLMPTAGGTKTRMEAIQQTPGSGSTETVMEQPNVTSSTARDTV